MSFAMMNFRAPTNSKLIVNLERGLGFSLPLKFSIPEQVAHLQKS